MKEWLYKKGKARFKFHKKDIAKALNEGWMREHEFIESEMPEENNEVEEKSEAMTPYEIAVSLARGEGLSQASWMRKMNYKETDRFKTKGEYDDIHLSVSEKFSGSFYCQNREWFLKKE